MSFLKKLMKPEIENKKIESKFTKPPSLMNVGATCYLNSALQGISSCDIFLEELSQLHKKYANLEKLSLFHKLIDILNGGKSDYLEISRNPIFRHWNKPGQQDSFELLAYVMNQVYNEIRKHLENEGNIPKRDMREWLKEYLPMRITIEYEIRCSCNSKVKVPLQVYLALHVAIPSKKILDLQSLVDRFFIEDDIEDYECDNEGCNGKGAKKYTYLLRPLPNTLCIHLQRTFWNGRKMQKIDNYIQFPKMLKINSKFTVSYNKIDNEVFKQTVEIVSGILDNSEIRNDDQFQKTTESPISNEYNSVDINDIQSETLKILHKNDTNDLLKEAKPESQINETFDKSNENQLKVLDENYFLSSVIVHHGSVYGGHYVCYKKMNDKWFLTNDSSIKDISENEVLGCKAYILFYEKNRADLKK